MTETFDYAFKPLAAGRRRPRLHQRSSTTWAAAPGARSAATRRLPREADRPQRRGDHLPRPHQQPLQREVRRLPHRADLRARPRRLADARSRPRAPPASCSTTCTPAAASRRSTTRRSSPRRCPSSPSCAAGARGTTRTPRPTTRRSTRSRCRRDRRRRLNPFTATRSRSGSACSAWATTSPRSAPATRTSAGARCGGPLTPQAPIGTPTTVVTPTSSRRPGIRRAVKAGHTYVKLRGNSGPDVRFTATSPRQRSPGDHRRHARANQASFVARVLGGVPRAPGERTADAGGPQGRSRRGRACRDSDDFSCPVHHL